MKRIALGPGYQYTMNIIKLKGFAICPSLSEAISEVGRYQELVSLNEEQNDLNIELTTRLNKLEILVREIIETNNILIDQKNHMQFDPASGILSFGPPGATHSIKLKRADPNVPVRPLGEPHFSSIAPATSGQETKEDDVQLRRTMEDNLEQFYYSAHRSVKLVQKLPRLGKFNCPRISIVRNKLLEHPEKGDPYTFSFGTDGPTIRPINKTKRRWRDDGLVINTESFNRSLVGAFRRALEVELL